LFDPKVYLQLVNLSYANQLDHTLTMRSITESNPRIVERLKVYFAKTGIAGGVFDRYVPAAYLLENFDDFKVHISEDTIEKAKTLVERINSLITEVDSIDTLNSSKGRALGGSRTASNKSNINATGTVGIDSIQSSAAVGSLPLPTQF
jgi:hypothetical protein